MRRKREIEKSYAGKSVVAKLRRLADALEQSRTFTIMIAGAAVRVPPDAAVEFEYEQGAREEEIEIEITWKRQERRGRRSGGRTGGRAKSKRVSAGTRKRAAR